MKCIFQPKTEQEIKLVEIIKTNKLRSKRKKALQELLFINGFDKNDLTIIFSKENFVRIKNQPPSYSMFHSAIIFYDNSILKR